MNESQLVAFMQHNNCLAKCGKPETLEAAAALEKRGMVEKVGEWKGSNPGIVYHLTDKAITMFNPIRTSPLVQFKDAIASSKLQEGPIIK